jgi:hypothetical protein
MNAGSVGLALGSLSACINCVKPPLAAAEGSGGRGAGSPKLKFCSGMGVGASVLNGSCAGALAGAALENMRVNAPGSELGAALGGGAAGGAEAPGALHALPV